MTLVLRTSLADPRSLAKTVRREVWALDKNAPITEVATLEELLGERLSQRRFNAQLLGLFSLLALVLAAIGVYGVVSYTVAQSTHDLGVRMALGAGSGDLLRLVLRQGMGWVLAGIVLGCAAALALNRVIANLLYGVKPADPPTFAGLSALLALVAVAAIYVPARRAAKTDPVIAMRAE
jgi:putative ABC transport system permease protein